MAKLIDGEKLLKFIEEHSYILCDAWNSKDKGMFLCGIKQAIKEQPTVDTERHAHWGQNGFFDEYENVYCCSNCKEEFVLLADTPKINNYNYCPECGCKMDEVTDKDINEKE